MAAIDLGYQMTQSARAGYLTVGNQIEHVVAFNELQASALQPSQALPDRDEWYKAEDFLENL